MIRSRNIHISRERLIPLNKAFSLITVAVNESQVVKKHRKAKPWFDKDCYSMKKAVRQSYQNSKHNFNTPEICKEHDDLVREFQSLKRYKKCSFEQITIENNIARAETDLNQFWQFWKRSQSKTSPMQVQPELWQAHFSTILQSDTPVVLPNPLPSLSNDILDAPITETDVLTAISHCKCNKSPGPDGIT